MFLHYSAIKFLCIFLKYLFVWNIPFSVDKSIYLWGMNFMIEYWTNYFTKRNGTGISVEKKYVEWKEEIAGNQKSKISFFYLVKLFIFAWNIIVNTFLKISKRRLYYLKKKNLFLSILTKLFFFRVFIRNKLLTRRRICNFQFHREWIFSQFIDERGYISFIYLEKINNRKMKFLRDIQRRRNIDLLHFIFSWNG